MCKDLNGLWNENGQKINVKEVLENRLATSLGLDKYRYIMEHCKETDVSKDVDFQRVFNGFYIVRRNEAWRKIYYDYFESVKYKDISFTEIITYMYEKTGNIEPSFSSKKLATLYPNKPIWDRYVVQNLRIQLDGASKEERLRNAISCYAEMEGWYSKFLDSDAGKECIRGFEEFLPNYKWVSDIKKVDAILWSIR
ncbi:hypothetical protein SAMN05216391_1147 [Lachnospiraceae bacterium KHCPX20]|nr:hypothetical protein SAMN05216391_1147 [Lachnospiraceae bacterium KHCPX20]